MPAPDKNDPRSAPNATGAEGHNGQQDRRQSTSRPGLDHVGPTLLDHLEALEEGRRRRDQAVTVARAATDPRWRVHVDNAIERLAASGRPFTAEDVRDEAGPPLGCAPTAMGGAIAAAHRRGLIVPVGFSTSRRPEAHARPVRVWQGVVD